MAVRVAPHGFLVVTPDGTDVGARHYAPDPAGATLRVALVLAHGAGAGHDHPFMTGAASGLARRGLHVVTFNFPYVQAGRRVPDRAPALERCFLALIGATRERLRLAGAPLAIGGKSLGGRMATHVAAHHGEASGPLAGVVCLGYPLHPPDRPHRLRTAHLAGIEAPVLVVQGARDPFGTPDELRPVLAAMPAPTTLHVVPDGDHSFGVTSRTPDAELRLAEVLDAVARWAAGLTRRSDA